MTDHLGTDALRQEFAEVLVVMSGLHETAVRTNDTTTLRDYASKARNRGRALFTADPVEIALTDQGFRQK